MALASAGDFHGSTLKSREVAGFTLREIVHAPGVRVARHSHEHAHLGFVLRGAFTERCERKTLECKPLSVSFLAPGASHSDDFHGGAHCLVFELAPRQLARAREYLPLDEPVCLQGGLLAWLSVRLWGEARRTDDASSLALEGLALEILAELSRRLTPLAERKTPRWLERAREILHARFDETLAHDEIAKEVGVHSVHLATIFRRRYGCTIGEYVRRLRIEFASREISASCASLTEIALRAGFSDQSHFTKVFRRHTGMTPAQFRVHLREP